MPQKWQYLWEVDIDGFTTGATGPFSVVAYDFYEAAQKAKKQVIDNRQKNTQLDPNQLIIASVVRKHPVIT